MYPHLTAETGSKRGRASPPELSSPRLPCDSYHFPHNRTSWLAARHCWLRFTSFSVSCRTAALFPSGSMSSSLSGLRGRSVYVFLYDDSVLGCHLS
ncbi:hypothetical protein ACN42_g7924 [Penicillium freii]|uniref:Uncharacterized protein n=1 Tax=Penicillium freii TaxID=48697 RepID=A0A101MER4_PENFR|nr:hypothetical protein ACN42_g7924 [Penicillium freii]